MPHLLLIEDNEHIVRIYREKFQREGFTVATAENGEYGLLLAQQGTANAILLDIMLPKLDGFDVLKAIRSDRRLDHIPVFMLSNRSSPDDIQYALSLGARQFYAKGASTLQDIVAQIRTECCFKKALTVCKNADAGKSIVSHLQHPKLLNSVTFVVAELVTTIGRGSPDIVILDGQSLGVTAFSLLQQIKTTSCTKNVPVIAITNQAQQLQRADAFVSVDKAATELRQAVMKIIGLDQSETMPDRAASSFSACA